MRDRHSVRAAFGKCCLGRVIGRVQVNIRHIAHQTIRPIIAATPVLLTGHKLKRAMHAEVQNNIGFQIMLEVLIKRAERMGRSKAAFEQQAHRIALVSERRLNADKDIAELRAKHENLATVGLDTTGCCTPSGFDLGEPRGLLHNLICTDARRNIGVLAIRLRVALKDSFTKRIHCSWRRKVIPLRFHLMQRVEQALEHRQISGSSNGASVRREAKQHDANGLFSVLLTAQQGKALSLFNQRINALNTGCHRLHIANRSTFMRAASAAFRRVTACENSRVRRAVNLWQSHEHRRFNRAKPLFAACPLGKGLEL